METRRHTTPYRIDELPIPEHGDAFFGTLERNVKRASLESARRRRRTRAVLLVAAAVALLGVLAAIGVAALKPFESTLGCTPVDVIPSKVTTATADDAETSEIPLAEPAPRELVRVLPDPIELENGWTKQVIYDEPFGDAKESFGHEPPHESDDVYPMDIAVLEDGSIAVADTAKHRIVVLDADGAFRDEIELGEVGPKSVTGVGTGMAWLYKKPGGSMVVFRDGEGAIREAAIASGFQVDLLVVSDGTLYACGPVLRPDTEPWSRLDFGPDSTATDFHTNEYGAVPLTRTESVSFLDVAAQADGAVPGVPCPAGVWQYSVDQSTPLALTGQDASGAWSARISIALPDGIFAQTAIGTDAGGVSYFPARRYAGWPLSLMTVRADGSVESVTPLEDDGPAGTIREEAGLGWSLAGDGSLVRLIIDTGRNRARIERLTRQ